VKGQHLLVVKTAAAGVRQSEVLGAEIADPVRAGKEKTGIRDTTFFVQPYFSKAG
jgi:hypothetical protein